MTNFKSVYSIAVISLIFTALVTLARDGKSNLQLEMSEAKPANTMLLNRYHASDTGKFSERLPAKNRQLAEKYGAGNEDKATRSEDPPGLFSRLFGYNSMIANEELNQLLRE